MRMTVSDPRVAEPYYRGTRFDRTGIILSLESGGHRYVQPWQRHYDPYSHDAVSGPAEEFLPVFPDAGLVQSGTEVRGAKALTPSGECTPDFSAGPQSPATPAGTAPVCGVTQPQRSLFKARPNAPGGGRDGAEGDVGSLGAAGDSRGQGPLTDGRSRHRSLDAGAPFLKIGGGLLQGDGGPYDRVKPSAVLGPRQMTAVLGTPAAPAATGPVSGVTQPQRSEDGRSRNRSLSAGPEPSDTGPSAITFRHFLDGYYDYEKLVEIPAEGRLRISHRLTNRSTLLFDTYVYCHNFFILDGAPTGRATRFTFPFQPVGDWRAPYDSVRLSDRGIVFDRDLAPSEPVFMGNLRPDPPYLLLPDSAAGRTNPALNAPPTDTRRSSTHTGPEEAGYRFTLQNLDNNLRVEAECDRAMDYAVFWSNADVSCLEPYIPLHLAPGQTARWTLDYRFR